MLYVCCLNHPQMKVFGKMESISKLKSPMIWWHDDMTRMSNVDKKTTTIWSKSLKEIISAVGTTPGVTFSHLILLKWSQNKSFLGIDGLSRSSPPLFTPSYPVLLFWACGVKAASHIRENGEGKVLERIADAEQRQKGALIIFASAEEKRGSYGQGSLG